MLNGAITAPQIAELQQENTDLLCIVHAQVAGPDMDDVSTASPNVAVDAGQAPPIPAHAAGTQPNSVVTPAQYPSQVTLPPPSGFGSAPTERPIASALAAAPSLPTTTSAATAPPTKDLAPEHGGRHLARVAAEGATSVEHPETGTASWRVRALLACHWMPPFHLPTSPFLYPPRLSHQQSLFLDSILNFVSPSPCYSVLSVLHNHPADNHFIWGLCALQAAVANRTDTVTQRIQALFKAATSREQHRYRGDPPHLFTLFLRCPLLPCPPLPCPFLPFINPPCPLPLLRDTAL